MKNNKSNKVEHTQNLQECVDYIMDNRSGWSQFTVWYMEKQGTNRQRANRVWTEAWGIITDDFEDNVKQSIAETMLKLEQIEESAMADNDRRMWLEVVKYRNKIKGGEIERHQIEHKGNVTINVNFE
tara:strand:+ start:905 stop:1285 length:381 start_codon:yes stop_codon:yes gene_type:complete